MKKEDGIFNVFESIITTNTISCTKCNKQESMQYEPYDCAEEFYSDGWRATGKNTYCPKCAIRYLKK